MHGHFKSYLVDKYKYQYYVQTFEESVVLNWYIDIGLWHDNFDQLAITYTKIIIKLGFIPSSLLKSICMSVWAEISFLFYWCF